AECVEAQVGEIALGSLEDCPPPAVEPLSRSDEQLGKRWLRVKVTDALQVVVSEDAEVDLVEDLPVRRLSRLPSLGVAALVGIGQAAERAQLVLHVDRSVAHAVADQALS